MKNAIYRDNQWYIDLTRNMLAIRRFEEEVQRQVDVGNIRGTTHVCIGQEAVPVGCCDRINKEDMVTSTHRGHGHFLASGGSMRQIMAELFGRRDGYCHGKGGTQHMASVDIGFVGSNGITGGGIPYATGMALAIKMRRENRVVISFFGDGAINQGTFHESLNMASIWQLPIVYVCENNQYAMGTSIWKMVRVNALSDRAAAYGMRGVNVDGNDVLAVAEAMNDAVEQVRTGEGPILLEARTYRLAGHSRNDKCKYRTREEEQEWAMTCPISRAKRDMIDNGIIKDAEWEEMELQVIDRVKDAVAFASQSETLSREQVLQGVYCQ